jgi:hypothetical protein
VIPREAGLAAVVDRRPAPYGVMALLSREPRFTAPQNLDHPQTNAWSAAELRRAGVGVRIEPATAAYAPCQVQGGYARPFRGPHLWSSEAMRPGRPEHVELRWDAPHEIGSIDLLFNDDVDEDLVNLHHHITPFRVIPELVRDYRLQAETADGWSDLVVVRDNRRRLRRHAFAAPVSTGAVRVVVESTNGSPWAMLHGMRVFAPTSD